MASYRGVCFCFISITRIIIIHKNNLYRIVTRNLSKQKGHIYCVYKGGVLENNVNFIALNDAVFEVDKDMGPSIHGPAGSQNVKKRKQQLLDCLIAKDLTPLNAESKLRHCAVVYGYISKEKIITHNINNAKQCEDDTSKQLDIALLSEDQNKHEWKQVTFHPGKHNTFITTEDDLPIHKAKKVVFGETVWALVSK